MKNRPKPQPHSSQADESSPIKPPSSGAVIWNLISVKRPDRKKIGAPSVETEITKTVVEARLFHEAREIVRTFFSCEDAVLQESKIERAKLPEGTTVLRRLPGGLIRGQVVEAEQKAARS